MNIYALQTARNGSKSVPNKNLLEIGGKPLYKWNYDYAKKLEPTLIQKTFISTDIPEILNKHNNSFKRPAHLCKCDSSHYETILHGLFTIENIIQKKVDILVILLGNNRGAYPVDLSTGIQSLKNNVGYDSAMSVGKFNMFNPYRAYKIKEPSKSLETYIDQNQYPDINNLNDKDAYGDVHFFNGSFWICRRECILKNKGLEPFSWLGDSIMPIVQDSKIMELDAPWQTPII